MADAKSLITRLNAIYRGLFHALTVGVRGAVIDEHSRVFLVRHTYVRGWHLPGGGVEVGEAAEEALRRELREEAGIELTGPPVLHGVFFNSNASPRDHVVVACPATDEWRLAHARLIAARAPNALERLNK